ncbi:glycerophosphoryl diester phosphodiesterase membrane domain-containing protein [Actinorugispora endophytica]|uniref:glycerophosphoryl diester phosphodiesterase membrane domain-containing protein n=1 Tax=Actinorugispora endophytica TaxID=1605990 RepID=UPI001FB754F3|nr:glycerophosphoryl diester phosphodiesterase membrane domain-containing protein [Actinorugispora endophytica]
MTFIVVAIVSVLPALGLADFSREYTTMIDTVIDDPYAEPETAFPFSGFSLLSIYGGSLLQLLGTSLLVGLLTGVVGAAVLGRRPTFGEAVRAMRGRLAALLGLTGLYLVFSVVAIILISLLFVLSIGLVMALDPLVGLAVLFLVGAPLVVLLVWAGVKTTLAMPVSVLEQVGPFRALARSWRLTSGSFWRLVGILLLTQILVQIVASTLSTPFTFGSMFVGMLIPGEAAATVASAALAFLGMLLTGCISSPFTAGVTALLYLDLRMRREGLDLRLQAAVQSGAAIGPEVYLLEPRPGVPA